MSMSRDGDRGRGARHGRGGERGPRADDGDAGSEPIDQSPAAILLRRARRLAKNGEHRKAALALRERAAITDDPATWVMAGAMWARARKNDDAIAALRHGMWLHQRAGSPARAKVVARILRELDGDGGYKLAS
ncbi:MAG: hypothetical protein U0234_27170 [Sandaracinus sp.]